MAVTNRKGGTGKTTTAVNLSACLAELGNKVLLIDLDPQGNATISCGIPMSDEDGGSIALLTTDKTTRELSCVSPVANLTVVPSGSALAAAEIELNRKKDWERILRTKLKAVTDDYILIDTPPAMGPLTLNALVAADGVIVPLQCDYLSLEGLREFASNLNRVRANLNPNLSLIGLIKTIYDERPLLTRHVAAELDRYFGAKVFSTAVPRNVRLAEAPSYGLPITLHASSSTGAGAYRQLARELQERLN